MKERIKSDPDSYTSLPPKMSDLVPKKVIDPVTNFDKKYFEDVNTGEKYYPIANHMPDGQEFISKLIKGIVPVSDIVYVVDEETGIGTYFSKETELEDYEEALDTDDMRSYEHLLGLLFIDYDHSIKFVKHLNDYHNVKRNETNVSFYDFGSGSFNFLENEIFSQRLLNIKCISTAILLKLNTKLLQLRNRFEDDKFISSLHEKIASQVYAQYGEKNIFSGEKNMVWEDFQRLLLYRIDILLERIGEVLQKREKNNT